MRDPSRDASAAHVRHNCAWSETEHRLFLLGLSEHGRGAWRAIASDFVTTRTATQVCTRLGSGTCAPGGCCERCCRWQARQRWQACAVDPQSLARLVRPCADALARSVPYSSHASDDMRWCRGVLPAEALRRGHARKPTCELLTPAAAEWHPVARLLTSGRGRYTTRSACSGDFGHSGQHTGGISGQQGHV